MGVGNKMIEKIYVCNHCATPCILRIQYLAQEGFPPIHCPIDQINDGLCKWELVE